jgi:hypothetical protein
MQVADNFSQLQIFYANSFLKCKHSMLNFSFFKICCRANDIFTKDKMLVVIYSILVSVSIFLDWAQQSYKPGYSQTPVHPLNTAQGSTSNYETQIFKIAITLF